MYVKIHWFLKYHFHFHKSGQFPGDREKTSKCLWSLLRPSTFCFKWSTSTKSSHHSNIFSQQLWWVYTTDVQTHSLSPKCSSIQAQRPRAEGGPTRSWDAQVTAHPSLTWACHTRSRPPCQAHRSPSLREWGCWHANLCFTAFISLFLLQISCSKHGYSSRCSVLVSFP